ncbi:MAG TPA: DUF4019 domain-containing protein [Roseateles sp.]|nr:DUF4019 domain-containing protein [Roseateles sp.]
MNLEPLTTGRPARRAALGAGLALLLGAGLAVVAPASRAQRSEPVAQAQAAAQQWLLLVDAGRYADSWDEAAQPFRDALAKPQWERSLASLRSPLGAVIQRTLISAMLAQNPPGAPTGESVIVQFRTDFEHRNGATETVAPLLERDGRWRVSGYFIRW